MRKAAFVATVSCYPDLACSKSGLPSFYVTPSATTVVAGQTVAVTLTSDANASRWTVSPTANSKATFDITTSKVNYFIFTKAGVCIISASTRNVLYDSASNQSLGSCWLHNGETGGCVKGVDAVSVKITVTN